MIALNENVQKSGTVLVPVPKNYYYAFADSDVFAVESSAAESPTLGNGYARRRNVREKVFQDMVIEYVQDCCALGTGPGCYPDEVTLEEYLGAVFQWCLGWNRLTWSMLYWPADHSGDPGQLSAVRAFGIWAGFMSEARGEHWDNKSRRGIK